MLSICVESSTALGGFRVLKKTSEAPYTTKGYNSYFLPLRGREDLTPFLCLRIEVEAKEGGSTAGMLAIVQFGSVGRL